ncbi:MAG: transcription elongation factor GreA [bacterium]|nr:transcription elongation factor GreA [bacterium]
MVKYFTAQGLEKLKKELNYLETVKRKEVTERLRHTSAQGDLKENAGYHAAKEQQGFVEGRIQELKEIVSQSKIIEKKEGDQVQMGSFICLESDEGEETFQLVGPEEADILQGKISFESPLGAAILKKKKGDVVEVDTPGGKRKYEIVEIK